MLQNRFSRRRILKGGALAVAGVTMGPWVHVPTRAAKAEHTLVFGHTFTEATAKYIVTGIELFKRLAEKYSDGKLLVDVYEGGALGGQNELPQKVLTGSVQGCQLSTQNFTPFSEVYNVLDFPFLFPSNEAFERVLEHPELDQTALIKQPSSNGFKVLRGMWSNSGYRVFATSKGAQREVGLPQDLEGLKVRVTSSKIEQKTFGMTPANPVSVAWAETYQAMQQGVADALNVGLGPLTAFRIHETLGAATRLKMSFNAHVTVLSRRWFERLPGEVQQAIVRAAQDSWAYQKEEQAKANARMWELWKEMGIEVVDLTEEERSAWIEAVGHQRSEWDEWRDRVGRDLYEFVRDVAHA